MKIRALGTLAAWILGLCGTVAAQPAHMGEGSLLIYPLFDSRPASATVINVTNTNRDRSQCGNGFRQGDVRVHYIYYGQTDSGSVCREFDRFALLTPADTLTVLASEHNPEGEVGFLTVSAQDPEMGGLISFDHLIGSAYVANSNIDIMWSYVPYPFTGIAGASAAQDACGRDYIRDANFGSPLVFDDTDYETFPRTLYVDSFFEENPGVFDNQLSLMSLSGQDYINEVSFLLFNNAEDTFSRTFKFVCHTTVPLSEISAVARNLGGDPDEFAVETGWVRIAGNRVLDLSGNPASLPLDDIPALLGVFVQIVRSDFTAGHALHIASFGGLDTQLPN